MTTQHHALLEEKRTSYCPQSAQGCTTRPAAKFTLTTLQNIRCSRTGTEYLRYQQRRRLAFVLRVYDIESIQNIVVTMCTT